MRVGLKKLSLNPAFLAHREAGLSPRGWPLLYGPGITKQGWPLLLEARPFTDRPGRLYRGWASYRDRGPSQSCQPITACIATNLYTEQNRKPLTFWHFGLGPLYPRSHPYRQPDARCVLYHYQCLIVHCHVLCDGCAVIIQL